MDVKRLTGVSAGSLKYDLLTALSVFGLHSGTRVQIAMNRLIAVITARYNWRLDEFSVGQRDLARMWNITERTVKREIKHWIDNRLIICKRPGVRGRVAAYRLNYPEIYQQTAPYWASVGPDFVERMGASNPVRAAEVVKVDFTAKERLPALPEGTWRNVCARLRDLHPATFNSWIAQLTYLGDDGRLVRVEAPTAFVAQYVETHFMTIMHEAVGATIGPGRRVLLSVRA
jgi:hypothetical protein